MWAYIVWFELKVKCFELRIASHLWFVYCLDLYLPWAHENYFHVNLLLHVAFGFGNKLDQLLGNNFNKKIIYILFVTVAKIIYFSPVNIFMEIVQSLAFHFWYSFFKNFSIFERFLLPCLHLKFIAVTDHSFEKLT